MELKTAIEILDYHQEWRLGKREDMVHEPKKLTEALDIVLSEVKKLPIHNVSKSLRKYLIQTKNTIMSKTENTNWLSPIESEREWQEKHLEKIFNNYPNTCPKWQYLNGLIIHACQSLEIKVDSPQNNDI
jgi:hypothetical protein